MKFSLHNLTDFEFSTYTFDEIHKKTSELFPFFALIFFIRTKLHNVCEYPVNKAQVRLKLKLSETFPVEVF